MNKDIMNSKNSKKIVLGGVIAIISAFVISDIIKNNGIIKVREGHTGGTGTAGADGETIYDNTMDWCKGETGKTLNYYTKEECERAKGICKIGDVVQDTVTTWEECEALSVAERCIVNGALGTTTDLSFGTYSSSEYEGHCVADASNNEGTECLWGDCASLPQVYWATESALGWNFDSSYSWETSDGGGTGTEKGIATASELQVMNKDGELVDTILYGDHHHHKNDENIYIDCSPTGEHGEELIIKDTDEDKKKGKKSKAASKAMDFIKNSSVQFIAGILIFFIVYFIAKGGFKVIAQKARDTGDGSDRIFNGGSLRKLIKKRY